MAQAADYLDSIAVDCHSFYPFFEGISENAYRKMVKTVEESSEFLLDPI